MGSIYQRGNTWWIKYYHRGKSYRESSKSTSKMVAKYFLAQRGGGIVEGKTPGLVYEKTKFKDLKKLALSAWYMILDALHQETLSERVFLKWWLCRSPDIRPDPF